MNSLRTGIIGLLAGLSLAGAADVSWSPPDRWLPVSAAEAKQLAADQGATWRTRLLSNRVLLGLGPDGRAKLAAKLASRDPVDLRLKQQLLQAADRFLRQPLPDTPDPHLGSRPGVTPFVAGSEEWMRPWGDGAQLLAIALSADPQAGYRERLHDLVLRLCAFPTWGASSLNADLAAGHVACGIAIAWSWHREIWSPEEQRQIIQTIRARVGQLSSAIYGGKSWWAGAYGANHNHISVAGAGLAGLAFLEDVPEAAEWLAAAWLDYQEVAKHSNSDGSSFEGVGYWTYGLSFAVEFVECSNGVLPAYSLYETPYFRAAAGYRIENSTPGLRGVIPWGDSGPYDFYGPQQFLYRLGSYYRNPEAQYVANHLPSAPYPHLTKATRTWSDAEAWAWLWHDPSLSERAPTRLDNHSQDIDVAESRSGWGENDYLLTLKGGFTNRDHSHLDVGAIALVAGPDWLLPAPGYGSGRVNPDFWDKHAGRWRYLSNSTEANSTLLVNGHGQRIDYAARGTIDRFASFTSGAVLECDLTDAYAGVKSARRRIFHQRGDYILIADDVNLEKPGRVDWLLQVPSEAKLEAGGRAFVAGHGGNELQIQLLEPAQDFTLHHPTSAVLDLPPAAMKTLAASESGTALQFVAALVPRSKDSPLGEFAMHRVADGHLRISRGSRIDSVGFNRESEHFSAAASGVSGRARFYSIRTENSSLTGIIVTEATLLVTPTFSVKADDALSIDAARISDSSWTVNLGPATEVRFEAAPGWEIIRAAEGDQRRIRSDAKLPSPGGSYLVRRIAADASAPIEKKDPTGRFQKMHASFLERGKSGPIGLLFLGDSITENWAIAPAIWERYYSAFQPANFGIGGDTTQNVIWRIAHGELDGIRPKVVVLLIGTNNTGTHTAREIAAADTKIVRLIQEKIPGVKILLLAVFPRGERKADGAMAAINAKHRAELINAINPALAALDDGVHVHYLDIGPRFLGPDGKIPNTIMADHLHPTVAGYQIWADAMQPILLVMER